MDTTVFGANAQDPQRGRGANFAACADSVRTSRQAFSADDSHRPAKAVLASKIPYREIFQRDAKAYALPQEALHVCTCLDRRNRQTGITFGGMEPRPKALWVS